MLLISTVFLAFPFSSFSCFYDLAAIAFSHLETELREGGQLLIGHSRYHIYLYSYYYLRTYIHCKSFFGSMKDMTTFFLPLIVIEDQATVLHSSATTSNVTHRWDHKQLNYGRNSVFRGAFPAFIVRVSLGGIVIPSSHPRAMEDPHSQN